MKISNIEFNFVFNFVKRNDYNSTTDYLIIKNIKITHLDTYNLQLKSKNNNCFIKFGHGSIKI